MMSTRVDHAYLEIKHRIVHGLEAPGAPLLESLLAQQLKTSRTPVREALARLHEEGYVEKVPGRGFFVGRITMTLVQNIFEVRRLLEGAAAARAAELADAPALAHLGELARFEYRSADPSGLRRAADANSRSIWPLCRPAGTPFSSTRCVTASTRSRASSPLASTRRPSSLRPRPRTRRCTRPSRGVTPRGPVRPCSVTSTTGASRCSEASCEERSVRSRSRPPPREVRTVVHDSSFFLFVSVEVVDAIDAKQE